jgi:GTP-binding protein
VIEKMGLRKGEMTNMETTTSGTHLEFRVPSRGLIGYRNEFLTDTRGTGTMNTLFDGYEAYKGEIESRNTAVMVSIETGKTVAFALFNLQERGQLILGSGVECYAGMIIGRAAKDDADMDVNPCKEKKLTNVRNKGAEEAVVLTTPMKMTLERAIEFIGDDELVEVTPESIRLRKAELDPNLRKRKSKVTA